MRFFLFFFLNSFNAKFCEEAFYYLGEGRGRGGERGVAVLIIRALDTKHEFLRHRAGASCIQFDHGALKLNSTLTILISASVHICRSVSY